ncbi:MULTISPECIES: restriction endonuclease subunit S [unclassified Synechococcus]|uniref:restriction endonuclease subunit S n=1 Tax=unclassified Synechococcus TaxID=2626047 RepID=UPI0021A4E6FA|nr:MULTISPECIES: restriction endonuclease subunit S [unclassified Synechococcus]MCT0212435.1 restriction endonuclease subunit S [Synechococcus sp. CS-1326]MCT0234618.1 restriction endonuclease subunit S [Synechococcus sp. CS-1327]
MSWSTAPLGDLCKVISGGTPKRSVDGYWGGDIPWVKISDMLQGDITHTDECITERGLHESPARLLKPGTLLLSIFATVGRTAILSIPAATNQAIVGLQLQTERLDRGYLRHFLDSQASALKLKSRGVAQDNINTTILKELRIPLPPLEEQRRIAAILDRAESVNAKLLQRERAISELEESLFDELLLNSSADADAKAIPLSDVYWFQEGPGVRNWQFTETGVKLLNVGNISTTGQIDLTRTTRRISEDEAYGKYSHFLVDPGDLVMPSSGISIDSDGLLRTRAAFVDSSHLPLCMNTSTIRFKPQGGHASLLFLQGWLQSREFRSQITRLVTGSAQKNFGPSHLKSLKITLPPRGNQEDFERKLLQIRCFGKTLGTSAQRVTDLCKSLQASAFDGEI